MSEENDRAFTAPLEGKTDDGESENQRETAEPQYTETEEDKRYVALARNAYTQSDEWFSTSIRKKVERALKHFQGQHPAGSKYHSTYYDKRSRLFRPKTRSMVRGTEAASAIAFFSTADAVNVKPFNNGNQRQAMAAEIHNSLINHRLQDPDMHWFLTVLGAVQDAATVGVVISRQDWLYESYFETIDGVEYEIVLQDRPNVELIPVENIRISSAAKWWDPINTSPFVIELIPMYVHEVKKKMKQTGRDGQPIYRQIPDGMLRLATKQDWDTIRRVRNGERRLDMTEESAFVGDYDICWVHRNIVKDDHRDMIFDTLGSELMLSSKPRPLYEAHAHRMRPYVMGFMVVESHKIYPDSPSMLVDSLQETANDILNLRMDNVRLALGKRYIVKRGRGVDTTSLLRNVPSSVTMASDPTDIKEVTTQDVTKSSYEEQDRINTDFDELAGRFSASSVATNRKLNETVGGMSMLSADANQIQEYQIRVVAETWLEPVMKQLVALESAYESDPELLAEVGEPLGVGVEEVIKLLRERVRTTVEVGFNATNPEKRIQRLSLGMNTMSSLFPQIVQAGDAYEIGKEIFGALGYKDASRFLPMLKKGAEDPRIQALQQQIEQLTQMLQSEQMKIQGQKDVATIRVRGQIAVTQMRCECDLMLAQSSGNIELFKIKAQFRLDEIDRMISVEGSDIKRRELYLQREALSHNVIEADRNFRLKVAQLGQKREEGRGKMDIASRGADREDRAQAAESGEDGGDGAMDLEGDDMAGTLSRDNYGALPGMGG